jgi:gluconate 5-dehydrogenase
MTGFDLSGKTAIVTGGGWGIGRALALGLAAHGARVAIADLDPDRAAGVVAEIGGSALAVTANVCQPDAVDHLFVATLERYGSIEILVNNAGGLRGRGPTVDVSLDDWRTTFDLCVTSAFLCSQRAGKWMIANGGGSIVNIASIYGMIGYDTGFYDPLPEGGQPESVAYSAAKGAMIAMTRTLATYWGKHGVRVNAIAPGPTKTERLGASIDTPVWDRFAARTTLNRTGTPEDLTGAAIYLASDASSFMTGQVLAVDGGWTAW